MVSGLLALLSVERDKIGAAPYYGCLRTLVEGIKPFVVRLGVKVLMTCFPASALQKKKIRNFGLALPVGLKIVFGKMLDSYHTSHISREPITDFKSVRIR